MKTERGKVWKMFTMLPSVSWDTTNANYIHECEWKRYIDEHVQPVGMPPILLLCSLHPYPDSEKHYFDGHIWCASSQMALEIEKWTFVQVSGWRDSLCP